MYICAYVNMYMHIFLHVSNKQVEFIHMNTYACMYTYTYVCIYIHMYVYVYASMYVCMYIHMQAYNYRIYMWYLFTYIYICIRVFIHICTCIQVALLGINSALGREQWEEDEGGREKERLGAIGAAAMKTAHELAHDAEQVHIGNVFICVTQTHSVTKLHELARRGLLIYTCATNSIRRLDITNSHTTRSRYTTYSHVSHELNAFLDYTN